MPSLVPSPRPAGRPRLIERLRLGEERGVTLIEMLVGMAISIVVLSAIAATLVFSARLQARGANYTSAQDDARTQLDEMVSQVRAATNIISSGPNSVDMTLTRGGNPLQVDYECDVPEAGTPYNECVRVQAAVGATLPALSTGTPVVTHLTNGTTTNPVFSWGPSPIAPYYMTATIDVPAGDGATTQLGIGAAHTIVLSDGALMRNENVQN